jgi:hypothetical protein
MLSVDTTCKKKAVRGETAQGRLPEEVLDVIVERVADDAVHR